METVEIYNDGQTKVSIRRDIHEFFLDYIPEDFNLSEKELDFVLAITIELLKARGLKPNNLKLASNVPVAKPPDCFIELKPPYDIFNEAFDHLCIWNTLDRNEAEAMDRLNEAFEEDGIFTFIFPRKIFDVKGFFYKEGKDECILMFFGFNNYKRY